MMDINFGSDDESMTEMEVQLVGIDMQRTNEVNNNNNSSRRSSRRLTTELNAFCF